MLPVFPKARAAMRDTFYHELFEAMWNVSPILKKIRVRPQIEGEKASFEREDGKTIELEYEALRVQRELKFDDAKGLDPEAFLDTAHEIGSEMGHLTMQGILQTVHSAIEEVGNVVNCEGGGITFDKYMELTSKIQTEFDEEGRPRGKVLVTNPGYSKQLSQAIDQWEADPVKRAMMEAVMQKKREEYDEREANRRMVD